MNETKTPASETVPEWPAPLGDPPKWEELQEWHDDGGCQATDGICWVEPDGVCQHGYPSWLLYWNMI